MIEQFIFVQMLPTLGFAFFFTENLPYTLPL